MFDQFEKIAFYLGLVGVFFLPFSLSLTQLFLYLGSLFLLVNLILSRLNISFDIPYAFLALYLWLFVISFSKGISFREIFSSEFKDLFLILFFLWSYYFVQSKYKNLLLKFINLVFILFLLIGFISLFLPFRLSNIFYHLQNGFIFDGKIRAQHLVFPLDFLPIHWRLNQQNYPIGIYMPVGFSGTHLSFGAQISIISFYYFSHFYLKLFNNKKNLIILFIISLYCMILLFFIQARSAIFGLSMMFIFFMISMNHYIKKDDLLKQKIYYFYKIILFFISIIIVLILIAITQSENFKQTFFQTIGIEKKHTDYQRILLWYTALRVFWKSPFIGYGLNQFQNSIFNEILQIIQEKPLLWYPLYQTEIMHGHNDFLHFLVIGGLIGGIFYLMFFYFEFKNIQIFLNRLSPQNLNHNPFMIFLFLPIFLLFAGLLQCYFLDDYTMQLFWILYGIAIGILNQNNPKEE